MENKLQRSQESKWITKAEVESKLNILVEGQIDSSKELQAIRNDLQKGFIGLALRNEELLQSNDQLKQQLDEVLKELNFMKQEREEKETRKHARASRKRLPKRDPMTAEIYKELIKEAEGPTYIQARTRIAFALLVVTGARINELLSLKVHQLETLRTESWIAIDRSKRGPSNHKAFLTQEGKKIISDRQRDFKLNSFMKDPDAYVFSSEDVHMKPITRVVLTKNVNEIMHKVSNQMHGKPNITSHSFRIGYITRLWKDTKDIEFVKQVIGHKNLETTSAYVSQLSNQDIQDRISEL